MTREEKNSYRIPYTTLRIHRSDCSYNKIKQPSPTPEPPPPPSPKPSPTPQGVTVKPLSSKIEVISWTTPAPMFASVEYKTSPFVSTNKEGAFFPSKSLSLNAPYTRVLSTRQDLCPTDLSANTLYYARLWIKDAGGNEKVTPQFTFKRRHLPRLSIRSQRTGMASRSPKSGAVWMMLERAVRLPSPMLGT